MSTIPGPAERGGVDPRLKKRLLSGAVDDNVRAMRNQPRGRLYRRPPWARWAIPALLAVIAIAAGAWAIFVRPEPAARIVYTPTAASGPASGNAGRGSSSTPFALDSSEAGGPLDLDEPPHADPSRPTRLPAQIFPVAVRRIVIDPGHGGSDEGTKTPNGLTEKILTLDLAQRLALQLLEAGYEVALTREADTKIYLRDRVRYANQRDADLFVSIHVNWFKDGRANRGIETYFLGPSDDPYITALASAENRESGYSMGDVRNLLDSIYSDLRQQESRRLAAAVQRHLVDAVREVSLDVRDRGVRSAPFLVLVETEMPAILAEVASLSSPEEARLLAQEDYRERLATALFEGIRAYSGVHEAVPTRETLR